MNNQLHKTFGAVAFAATLVAPLFSQTLLLEYKFNDSGTTSQSTGTLAPENLILRNSAGVSTDLHGAAGSGVSGLSGDFAFNNTASTGMGNAGVGGYAVKEANNNVMQGLTSFTVTGWFKTEGATAMAGNARLLDSKSGGGIWLRTGDGASAGTLLLGVNASEVSAGATSWNQGQAWTFFAVTYNGGASSNNVRFYVGNGSTSVTLAATVSLNTGSVAATTNPFVIGNGAAQNNRSFDGFLDNIRIYNGIVDASGLETIRATDVSPIPEPASAAVLAGMAGLVAGAGRRRSRR